MIIVCVVSMIVRVPHVSFYPYSHYFFYLDRTTDIHSFPSVQLHVKLRAVGVIGEVVLASLRSFHRLIALVTVVFLALGTCGGRMEVITATDNY